MITPAARPTCFAVEGYRHGCCQGAIITASASPTCFAVEGFRFIVYRI